MCQEFPRANAPDPTGWEHPRWNCVSTAALPRPLPSTGARSGVLEALAFFRDANFASRRFKQLGNVFETSLLGQQLVFIRGPLCQER